MIEAQSLAEAALAEIRDAADLQALERIRLDYLGRGSGRLSALLEAIGSLPKEERPAAGKAGNEAKNRIEAALAARAEELERRRLDDLAELESIDVTFPAPELKMGRLHVLTQVQRELEEILGHIGFAVEIGPEVETDWYNFEALNLPKGHASRDVQDTFFLNAAEDVVLRTHTSPVQIRAMERLKQPPIYVIVPGRVYRRDASDPSHTPTFMQLEGLAVDEGLTVGDLKGTLTYMCQSLFGPERRIRMRPHNFSYTEPSFEFDSSCGICGGKGCRSCGGDGWLEIGGCGMVHPNVLRNGGIDPDRYTGYAWGFGIERMAALKYNVPDIRYFYENDVRFLETF
ncbi:MAG TPA: phenylalanine--tRNA ligase subunit alpha [Candidatus Dormibacteraeota bacterium]